MGAELAVELRVSVGDFVVEVAFESAGRPVALVGPNGAGKTTVLRALAGAPGPVSGRVRVADRTWVGAGEPLPPEARGVGYLPQGFGLFPHLSALDNVAFGLREGGRGARRERARELLDRLGVGEVAARRPAALSGGERQRVALARALAADPALLLLDEPTASLDVGARRAIRELLGALFSERAAVVVTHDLRDLLAWDPLVVLIDGGRVVERGTVEALREVGHPFLEELLQPLGR